MQTKRDLVLIQSPRGQINVTAPIGFPIESAENHMNQNPSTTSSPRSEIDDTDSHWSNPVQNTLHPQILRKIAYSNNLLHITIFGYYIVLDKDKNVVYDSRIGDLDIEKYVDYREFKEKE